MLLLSQLTPGSGYVSHVLPAEILLGLGMGCVFVPAFSVATQGVAPREAGVASAVVNTAQQVGGSVGTALLNTIAASATAAFVAAHPGPGSGASGLVHGFTVAALWGAGILTTAAVLAALLVTARRPSTQGGTS
jgi:MFS family permease